MSLRQMISNALGRKAPPSPWDGLRAVAGTPLTAAPRDSMRATAADAAQLLARYENAVRRQESAERRPSLNEPHMPKWWE